MYAILVADYPSLLGDGYKHLNPDDRGCILKLARQRLTRVTELWNQRIQRVNTRKGGPSTTLAITMLHVHSLRVQDDYYSCSPLLPNLFSARS